MSERNDKTIREALDRIEPAEGAKERMLQNIRHKAEAANATKTEPKKSRRMLLYKLLPAVAAAVVVIVGVWVFKDGLMKKPAKSNEPGGSVIAAGTDEKQVVSYSKVAFSEETGEDPELPKYVTEVEYLRNYAGYYVAFAAGEHRYQLYLFRPEGDKMHYVAVNYVEGVTVEEWQQGECIYRLVNSDGATQEEMEEIKAGIHKVCEGRIPIRRIIR